MTRSGKEFWKPYRTMNHCMIRFNRICGGGCLPAGESLSCDRGI